MRTVKRRGALPCQARPFGESVEHRFVLIESCRELIKESISQLKCLHVLVQFFPFKVQKRPLVAQVTRVATPVQFSLPSCCML
jgi:hypothetical protein